MNLENPYTPPAGSASPKPAPEEPPQHLGAIARPIFLAWEKLRLVYIAVLAFAALGMATLEPQQVLASLEFWRSVIVGAIAANLCFFAGQSLRPM
jgi:hypothetical protein